jgi:hypothetical protein
MKSLIFALVVLTALPSIAMSPPTRRDPAPALSAVDAIRAASAAIEAKGSHYYCASVELEPQSTLPDPRFAARHWRLVFYEAEHRRIVEAGGKQSFGDIEVRVTMSGEVFATRQLSFGPSAAPAK